MLQLWLNQTDFDNKDGAVEFVTVKVAGKEVLCLRNYGLKNGAPKRNERNGPMNALKRFEDV